MPVPTPNSSPSIAPTTSTPDEQYSIEYLRRRAYGGGEIETVQVLEENDSLTRYLVRYPSDNLTIYGYITVPKGVGPYPIIIAVHGLVPQDTYAKSGYDTDGLDRIARGGYIVMHPFLRTYFPSDGGDNLHRVGMAIDVLNLIALAKSESRPGEIFNNAAPDRIGLWGYSLGGSIVLRVLTVSPEVRAAVLYASMSGDERKNSELLWQLTSNTLYQIELAVPAEKLKTISPVNHYEDITAPVQLFHGTADSVVPFTWAQETCGLLTDAGVEVTCTYFDGEDHSFRSRVAEQFHAALFGFYEKYLAP